jgi:hypothetical protein
VNPNTGNKNYASNNLSYPDKFYLGCKIVAINPRSVSTGNYVWYDGKAIPAPVGGFATIQIMKFMKGWLSLFDPAAKII